MTYVFYHNSVKDSTCILFDQIFQSFPLNIQLQISKYRNQDDRNRAIIGKALLVEALKALELKYHLNELKYTKYNRPFFNASLDFNISHSYDFVVCAISKKHQVGIDIERIKPVVLADLRHVFSGNDWNYIINDADPIEAFYSLWTKKESFLKAVGTGFHQPLSTINFTKNKIAFNSTEWIIKKLMLHKEYSCHLTTNLVDAEIQLKEIKFN